MLRVADVQRSRDAQPAVARGSPRLGVGRPVRRDGPVCKTACTLERSPASGRPPLSGSRRRTGNRPRRSVRSWRQSLGGAAAQRRRALDDRNRGVRRRHGTAVPDVGASPNFRGVRFVAVKPRRSGHHGDRVGRLSRERRSENSCSAPPRSLPAPLCCRGRDRGYASTEEACLIAAACLAWGIDNNLTRKLSSADPVVIAMIKGLMAGSVNLALALTSRRPLAIDGHAWRRPRRRILRRRDQSRVVCVGAASSRRRPDGRLFLARAVSRRDDRDRDPRRAGDGATPRRRRPHGVRPMAASDRTA